MIKDKYLKQLTFNINKLNVGADVKFFIFGSSLRNERFGDIDVGVMGNVEDDKINELKEEFENSTFPYFVEFINLNSFRVISRQPRKLLFFRAKNSPVGSNNWREKIITFLADAGAKYKKL